MFKIGLKSVLAHKRRLLGTMFAVFLGVAFLSGTLVFGDTAAGSFNDLFAAGNAGTDAVVRGDTVLVTESATQRAPIDG
jgi:putative ABC transport system permease protein